MTKSAHNIKQNPEYETVGATIARLRETAKMSRAELARRVGLPPQAVFVLEAGERRVDVIELCRIAAALDVPATILFEDATEGFRAIHGDDEELLSAA